MSVQSLEVPPQAATPMLPRMPSHEVQTMGPFRPKANSKMLAVALANANDMRRKSLQKQQDTRRKQREVDS